MSLMLNPDADTQMEETQCVAVVSLKIPPFRPSGEGLHFNMASEAQRQAAMAPYQLIYHKNHKWSTV